MGFWKKFTGFLGLGPENNTEHDDENHINGNSLEEIHNHHYSNLPRKGFSVPVQVPVDRAHQIGPILLPCAPGDGGLQGLGWYTRRLMVDEDGDVADEFLEEIFPETSSKTHQLHYPKIEVKLNTKPAKTRNPVLTSEGMIQQFVEHRGRFLLV